MGMDVEGILFYGFEVGDSDWDSPWATALGDDFDWEKLYLQKMGFVPKNDLFTPEGEYRYQEGTPEYIAAYKVWKADLAVETSILDACPVTVFYHCSSDCPVWCVAIKEKYHQSSWGEAKKIVDLNVRPDSNNQLKKFCDLMGLEYADPNWYLVSYYST